MSKLTQEEFSKLTKMAPEEFSKLTKAEKEMVLMRSSVDTHGNLKDFPLIHERDSKDVGEGAENFVDLGSEELFDDSECSSSTDEEDGLYLSKLGYKAGLKDSQIQTSTNHFLKMQKKLDYKRQAIDRAFSVDFRFSPMYDDLQAKQFSGGQGCQVDEAQIWQSYARVFTQIECEYQVSMLKKQPTRMTEEI